MPQPIDLPDSSNTASASRTAIAWRHMVGVQDALRAQQQAPGASHARR